MNFIDIGNRVFDQLVAAHGEIPEERLNFFTCILAGQPWRLPSWTRENASAVITVSQTGISFGIEDSVISAINTKIQEEIAATKAKELATEQAQAQAERAKAERMLKDGAVYNFWDNQSNNTNIEIKW
jgi:hypothetical protein